jgi:competence protein ComEA
MTNETREVEPKSPFFSGWRKAVLWLVGAGALAVVGYRGSLGTETAAGAPLSAAAPARSGAERTAPDVSAAPAPSSAPGVSASVRPAGSPTAAPASQMDSAPAETRKPASPSSPMNAADSGDVTAPAGHIDAVPSAPAITPDGKVVLNLATEAELRKLPGIGKSRARAIVEQRGRLGRFRRLEDLLRVKGIGLKRLAALRAKVVLDAP